jgi:hypothetical protein
MKKMLKLTKKPNKTKTSFLISLLILTVGFCLYTAFYLVAVANLALCAAANTEDYYDKLASGCKNNNCCLASVKTMKQRNYTLAPQEGCPSGYQGNMMLCIDSYRWCQPTQTGVFSTKAECEQKTGKSCGFEMCDYIPAGKTIEEVCGKNFKKGWVPR